jgi:hypothetical protein
MQFYRVIDGIVIGGAGGRWIDGKTPSLAVGDTVTNVFATPRAECVTAMLEWSSAYAASEYNGSTWAAVVVIETDDYTSGIADEWRTGPYREHTDRDEVYVFDGTVVDFIDYQKWRN